MSLGAHFQPEIKRRDRDTLADGSYWAYSYNNRSEVTGGVKHLPPQGEAPVIGHSFGYAFDPIGNRTQTTVNGRMAGYSRNALNQYPERTVPPAADVLGSAAPETVVKVTGPQGTQTAVRQGGLYHAAVSVDNRTAAQYPEIGIEARRNTAAGETVTDTKSTTAGRLFVPKQPEDFAYDEAGNTLHDGRWVYTWDGENRMIAAETRDVAVAAGVPRVKVEYAYDWRSRRIQRKVSTNWNAGTNTYNTVQATRLLYDAGWNVLAEINASGTVVRGCLWGLDLSGSISGAGGIGGLLVESISDPNNNNALTDCLPFYDGNGNITGLISAASGTEVARYSYGPFGETLRQSGPLASANSYRWSTKYQDDLTGLKNYGYRWLGDGRWMSRDPIGEGGGDNLYGFSINRATTGFDIFGLTYRITESPPYDRFSVTFSWLLIPKLPLKAQPNGVTLVSLAWSKSRPVFIFADGLLPRPFCITKVNGIQSDEFHPSVVIHPRLRETKQPLQEVIAHEQHHADFNNARWKAFAEYANGFEGKCFCTARCQQLAQQLILSRWKLEWAQGSLEDANYDWNEYGFKNFATRSIGDSWKLRTLIDFAEAQRNLRFARNDWDKTLKDFDNNKCDQPVLLMNGLLSLPW